MSNSIRSGTPLAVALSMVVAGLAMLVPRSASAAEPGWFNALTQATVADSSTGTGMPKGKLGAGVTRTIAVAGMGGVPADGSAAAVDVLVTASAPSKPTAITVFEAGTTRPTTAALHAPAKQTVSSTVTVPLDDAGELAVHNLAGKTHVSVAVLSWHRTDPTNIVTGDGFTPADEGLIGSAKVKPNRTKTFAVLGKGGVPATGVTAVQLGLSVVTGTKPVRVTVRADGAPTPAIPTLHVPAKRQRSTTTVVPIPVSGKVKVTVSGGAGTVRLSNRGFQTSEVGEDSTRLTPASSVGLVDTRTGLGAAKKPLKATQSIRVQVTGRATVPTEARAVVLGVVLAGPAAPTVLGVTRDGAPKAPVSTVAAGKGETVAARMVVPLSDAGKIRLSNAGGKTHVQVAVEGWYAGRPPVPPDPEPEALPASVVEAAKQLTTGDNPRQTGVEPGTIDPTRVSILTGSVVSAGDGQGVANAVVRIKDHPELGQTRTAKDGTFAMAVNGGGTLVTQVVAENSLPVQRTNDVAWLVWQQVPSMALTALDPNAGQIDQNSTEVQAVVGATQSDSAGTRTSALLFEPGTGATMTLEDGSTAPLDDTMTVRTTEYTTGEQGQQAMPGLLPYNTGYTFAAEYSVDEALEAGATEVTFDKPVNTYVDNFLDLPTGTTVPSGYYDRDKARWVAGPNGLAIDVVGESGGLAQLNTDADPAADPETYSGLGIDTAELAKLAELYDPGAKLWRVEVEHFTPWDYNFPYGPPPGAGGPPGPGGPGSGGEGTGEDKKRPCSSSGSVILCESQTLQEIIDLTGTPLSMRYSSDDVPGRATGRELRIRVKDGSAVGPLQDISVTVSVAGRTFERSLDPATVGEYYTFVWDGKDADGQMLVGTAVATVTVGYGYKFEYKEPQDFQNSFAQFGTGTLFRRGGSTPASRPESTYIERTYTQTLSSPDRRREGNLGWSFDQVHRYDPEQRRLTLGDGRSVSAGDILSATVETVAGTGSRSSWLAEGPATETSLGIVRGVASGPDGTVYFADSTNNVVARITPEGDIDIVAGGGDPADGLGDGGPATSARLDAPWDVAVAPDGSLFIADAGDNRIRRVSPTGTISTVAGGGTPADGIGDGLDATKGRLSDPRGIALSADGELYIADTGHDRVRMLSADGALMTVAGGGTPADGLGDGLLGTRAALDRPVDVASADKLVYIADSGADRVRILNIDGTIDTFAGDGTSGAAQDGLPATESSLAAPSGVAVGPAGQVYVADRLHNRIRRVNSNGVMVTAAGTGLGTSWWSTDDGDGALPTKASLTAPTSVATTPSGGLVMSDSGNFRIRTAGAALPGNDATAFAIPSLDGTEVFEFDQDGRHLQTRDAMTGVVRLEIAYDAAGRVASVTDAHDQTHTVQRSGSGALLSVTAATGEVTSFTADANGWLTTAVDNAGQTTAFGYTAGGLLTSMTDRAGGVHLFQYDGVGRLVRDEQPTGGFVELAPQQLENGRLVTMTSSDGKVRTVEISTLPDGTVRRRTVEPDGGTTTALISPDGTARTTDEDGRTVTIETRPDLRWGSLVQVPLRVSVTEPSGTTSTTEFDYEVELADAGQPLSMTRWKQRATTTGLGTVTQEYVSAARTLTRTGVDGVAQVMEQDSRGNLVRSKLGTLAPTTYTYDGYGRVLTTTEGTGTAEPRVTTFTYSGGALATTKDALGRVTTFASDGLGRVTRITHPDGEVEEFTYDGEGRRTSVTPADAGKHEIGVTDGRMSSYDAPGGPAPDRRYTYTLDGLLDTVRNGDGTTTDYTYDPAGRLVQVTAPGGTDRRYGYTARLLTSILDAQGPDLTLGYDDDRMLDSLRWSGQVAGAVTLRRNDLNRIVEVDAGGGTPIPYSYNNNGQVTGAGSLSVQYDPNGLYDGDQAGSISTSVTRNDLGEPEQLTYTASGSTVFEDDVTSRDKLGRVLTRTETVAGSTSTLSYTYDDRGRLTRVQRDGTTVESYGYDANGNRTSRTLGGTTDTFTYNARDQLVNGGGRSYSYDADGNLAAAGPWSYTWDRFGRLTRAQRTGDPAVGYLVDGFNQRVGRTVGGALVDGYLYDDKRRVVAWTDGSGAVKARFAYRDDSRVPALMMKGSSTYRILTDTNGSVRSVVDVASGVVAQELEYDGFGRVVSDSEPGFQPFGFAGGMYDETTGLVHFDTREYDPATGRWLSPDLVGFDGGQANLYGYVGNDPVNFVDQQGTFGFPGFDLPKLPKLNLPTLFPGGCLSDLLDTGLELLTYVPGPVGMAANGAQLVKKCFSPGSCSLTDVATTAVGMVPGGKAATKVLTNNPQWKNSTKTLVTATGSFKDTTDFAGDVLGGGGLVMDGIGYGRDVMSYY